MATAWRSHCIVGEEQCVPCFYLPVCVFEGSCTVGTSVLDRCIPAGEHTISDLSTLSWHQSFTCSEVTCSSLRWEASYTLCPEHNFNWLQHSLLINVSIILADEHSSHLPSHKRGLALSMPVAVKNSTFFINRINVQQYKYRRVCVLCCLVLLRLPVNLITNHSFFFFFFFFHRQDVKANQPTPICATSLCQNWLRVSTSKGSAEECSGSLQGEGVRFVSRFN